MKRIWAIGYGYWSEGRYGEDLQREGFYLLEADALAQVDHLNLSLRHRYVSECVKKGKAPAKLTFEQWLDKCEEARFTVMEMQPGLTPNMKVD